VHELEPKLIIMYCVVILISWTAFMTDVREMWWREFVFVW